MIDSVVCRARGFMRVVGVARRAAASAALGGAASSSMHWDPKRRSGGRPACTALPVLLTAVPPKLQQEQQHLKTQKRFPVAAVGCCSPASSAWRAGRPLTPRHSRHALRPVPHAGAAPPSHTHMPSGMHADVYPPSTHPHTTHALGVAHVVSPSHMQSHPHTHACPTRRPGQHCSRACER